MDISQACQIVDNTDKPSIINGNLYKIVEECL